MRADQLIMLGVVGLGGYAAYRMLSASPTPPGGPTPGGSTPGGPTPLPGTLPSGMVVLGNPLRLKEGQFYAGRLNLPAGGTGIPGLDPFVQQAAPEATRAALEALGFTSVVVYPSIASTVPQKDHFPAETLMNPHSGTRWFIGKWNKPTMDVPRPPVIEQMWVTRTPQWLPVVSGESSVTTWVQTPGGKLAGAVGLAVGAALLSDAYPAYRVPLLGGAALGLGALYLSAPKVPAG